MRIALLIAQYHPATRAAARDYSSQENVALAAARTLEVDACVHKGSR